MWGNSGTRHSQRVALAPGDEGPGPVRAGRALCPRQGQAMEQGRTAAETGGIAAVGFRHAGGATVFSGSAGASRPSRKASARVSPAPRMSCWRWTMIWKRSAPMPMNCRWSPRRWRTTIPSCAGRPIVFSTSGAIPMAAICWSRFRCLRHQAVPARRARMGRGLDRIPAGQARRQSPPARRSSRGGRKKAATPGKSCWFFPTAWMSARSKKPTRHFEGRVRVSFGWGTNLTNDFVGCAPNGSLNLDPISIVCKVTSVDGRPAVKLSDNPEKATGSAAEVERYLRVFGQCGTRACRGACVRDCFSLAPLAGEGWGEGDPQQGWTRGEPPSPDCICDAIRPLPASGAR